MTAIEKLLHDLAIAPVDLPTTLQDYIRGLVQRARAMFPTHCPTCGGQRPVAPEGSRCQPCLDRNTAAQKARTRATKYGGRPAGQRGQWKPENVTRPAGDLCLCGWTRGPGCPRCDRK